MEKVNLKGYIMGAPESERSVPGVRVFAISQLAGSYDTVIDTYLLTLLVYVVAHNYAVMASHPIAAAFNTLYSFEVCHLQLP